MCFSFPLARLEVYNNIGFNIPTFLVIPVLVYTFLKLAKKLLL